MAETDGHLTETTNNPPAITPLPSSIPIHLSGFLSGDTIQVQGDTDNLQFSVQFNIHHKYNNSDPQCRFPPTLSQENQIPLTYSTSSYATPATYEVKNQDAYGDPVCNTVDWTPTTPQHSTVTNKDAAIVTRLKSGVLSPVTYYPPSARKVHRNVHSSKHELKKRGRGKMDLLERVLKRHSLPIRPCNSYSFFVMASWGVVKSNTFGDTSKRLGEMWGKLPHSEKKVFKDMAFKDHARYKKQCRMLMSKRKRNIRAGKMFQRVIYTALDL